MYMKYLRKARDLMFRSNIPGFFAAVIRPFSHRSSSLEVSEARRILEDFSHCPEGSAYAKHRLEEPFSYDLQIVVNVYNLEKYIRECADSILSQEGDYKWRLIFVDDGSQDASASILDTYAADPRVRVIHQSNVGQASKNTGLEELDAEYVMFVDGDDMLEPGTLRKMLDAARQTDADIVQIGMSRLENGQLDRMRNVKRIREASPYGEMMGFACGKLIRSRLFETVQFPHGFWHADTIMSFLIFPMSVKRIMLPDYGYLYRCSSGRLSKKAPLKPKCADTYWITERMLKEHKERDLAIDSAFYDELLRQVLLNFRRMRKVPERIKEAVFVLTADLLERFFEKDNVKPSIHRPLRQALKERDYGVYALYCRTHF